MHAFSRRLCVFKLLLGCYLALLVSAPVSAAEHAEAISETPVTDADREHWAFSPLVRPSIPTLSHPHAARNPIDCFIGEKLEAKQIAPRSEADRGTLIRRLYFDLVGLPPSRREVEAFTADASEQAYERLVDHLLASPHYGERWAQHWLDLARFAETDGFEHDKVRSEAWRYRDWVIAALNSDLPYDRFISLQLAGDELQPDNEAARVATTFCLSGPDMPDINSQEERRQSVLNEVTATVGGVLLGLQVGCAQCHDHKYDPISQADFYRLRAIFEPAVSVKKNQSLDTLSEDGATTAVSHLMIRGDWQRKGPEVSPAFPRIANPAGQPFQAVGLDHSSGRRSALARWLTEEENPLVARVIANRVWQYHFGEGLSRSPSDFGIVGDAPSHPELLDWLACELIDCGWSLKHLHRLIITSATYRQASRAADNDASAKSQWAEVLERDPANLWLSRFPRRRLSGEAIRDAMYAVSGTLRMEQGGAGVMPPLPSEIRQTLLKGQWDVSPREADHYRRSIYIFARRNLRYPIFEAFDRPDANASCPRRNRSTTAPQSLLLLNSDLSLDAARRLAGSVLASDWQTNEERLNDLFLRLFARAANDSELHSLSTFLQDQTRSLREEGRFESDLALPIPNAHPDQPFASSAWTDLCLALLNLNDFVYVD